jgi:hypothetical protein
MMMMLGQTTMGLDPATVGTIIGGIIAALVGGGIIGKRSGKTEGKAEGKAEALQIGPQPFMIELKEQFITRREFDQLAGMVAVNNTEIKGLFKETMQAIAAQNTALTKKIENQNARLTQDIKEMGTGDYQGRKAIWEQVNHQREDLAAIKATSNVAGEIGKLAEALSPQTKVQPTHPNKS